MNSVELLGDTIIIAGEILLAYTVIAVHASIKKEQKVDKSVFSEIQKEQIIGLASICILAVGFIIRVFGRYIL